MFHAITKALAEVLAALTEASAAARAALAAAVMAGPAASFAAAGFTCWVDKAASLYLASDVCSWSPRIGHNILRSGWDIGGGNGHKK